MRPKQKSLHRTARLTATQRRLLSGLTIRPRDCSNLRRGARGDGIRSASGGPAGIGLRAPRRKSPLWVLGKIGRTAAISSGLRLNEVLPNVKNSRPANPNRRSFPRIHSNLLCTFSRLPRPVQTLTCAPSCPRVAFPVFSPAITGYNTPTHRGPRPAPLPARDDR
jgi:hypothetical protein